MTVDSDLKAEADIEGLAKAWLEFQGFTAEDIVEGERQSCANSGCEFSPDIGFYQHEDEWGRSLHPLADVVNDAAQFAVFAVEWFERKEVNGDEG